MARERDLWWISANTLMNILFASIAENSLNCREPVSHSVWALLHGVSNISFCLRGKYSHHYNAESAFAKYQHKAK